MLSTFPIFKNKAFLIIGLNSTVQQYFISANDEYLYNIIIVSYLFNIHLVNLEQSLKLLELTSTLNILGVILENKVNLVVTNVKL